MTNYVGERLSETVRQAEAFLDWWRCLGSADRGGAFRRWARSKDFAPPAARRIARAVGRRTEDDR